MRIIFVFWVSGYFLFANQLFLITLFMLKYIWNLMLSNFVDNYEVKSKYIWNTPMSTTHRYLNNFLGTTLVSKFISGSHHYSTRSSGFVPIMICCPSMTFSSHNEHRLTVDAATCPFILTPLRTSDVT